MNSHSHGFTLIELMMVIAILGILMAVALPAYQDYTTRAQIAEGLSLAAELQPSVRDYYVQRGEFPADNAAAGVPDPEYLLGNYVQGIEVADGAIHVRFGHKINLAAKDKVLSIRPIVVDGSPASPISWVCGGSEVPPRMSAAGENRTDVPSQLLPSTCR